MGVIRDSVFHNGAALYIPLPCASVFYDIMVYHFNDDNTP